MQSCKVTCAVGGGVAFVAETEEAPRLRLEPAGSPAPPDVLALKAPRRHRDLEVHPNAVLRDLVVRREVGAHRPPVHARVRGAVLQQEPQRLRRLGVVGAAASPPVRQRVGTLGRVAAQVRGAVAGRVAAVGEALAERGLGLHDDGLAAAVEEEVVVLGREREAGAGVEAEGVGRAPEHGVVGAGGAAAPHGRVVDDEVGVGVVDGVDGVRPRGCAEE